jgi:hypothetical protein
MSYLYSDPFDQMDEDEFFEDIDEQEDDFDVPVDVDEDAALDEYEMVLFPFSLTFYSLSFILVLINST